MQEEEEPQIQAPPVDPPPPHHETPGVQTPSGDPFLEALFPKSPAGYGVVVLVVICAVLVVRKYLRRARPSDLG